jgi:hypothetical protein
VGRIGPGQCPMASFSTCVCVDQYSGSDVTELMSLLRFLICYETNIGKRHFMNFNYFKALLCYEYILKGL